MYSNVYNIFTSREKSLIAIISGDFASIKEIPNYYHLRPWAVLVSHCVIRVARDDCCIENYLDDQFDSKLTALTRVKKLDMLIVSSVSFAQYDKA